MDSRDIGRPILWCIWLIFHPNLMVLNLHNVWILTELLNLPPNSIYNSDFSGRVPSIGISNFSQKITPCKFDGKMSLIC